MGTQDSQETEPLPLTCWNMPSGVRTADTCCPAPPQAEQVLGVVPGLTPLWSHVPHLQNVVDDTIKNTLRHPPRHAKEMLAASTACRVPRDGSYYCHSIKPQGAVAAAAGQNRTDVPEHALQCPTPNPQP